MNDDNWYSLLVNQANAVTTLWNIYIAVILGLLAFMAQKGDSIKRNDIFVLMGAFFIFAISNVVPLYHAQVALVAIHSKLPDDDIYWVSSTCVVVGLHVIFDVLVLSYFGIKAGKAK